MSMRRRTTERYRILHAAQVDPRMHNAPPEIADGTLFLHRRTFPNTVTPS
jgi:hypothetical protein